jgi:uncharacterized protein YggT (Ycf19 family)
MIRWLIEVYIILIIIDSVMSFVPNPDVQRHPFVLQLRRLTDFTLRPVREMMPAGMPFDFSPIVVILLLRMIASLL